MELLQRTMITLIIGLLIGASVIQTISGDITRNIEMNSDCYYSESPQQLYSTVLSANFTFEPIMPMTYQTIYFNSTSTDTNGTIVNWTWNMDDGMILYDEQITYHYTDDGEYDVLLTVTNNHNSTDSMMKTVSVTNQPPVVVNDSSSCGEDKSVWTHVTANDTDTDGVLDLTTLMISSLPNHGTTFINQSTGMIQYTPNPEWNGIDSYEYQISDDDGATDTAIVTITVNDINDPPVAHNDSRVTDEDKPIWIKVVDNDNDIDGFIDPATLTIITNPSNGSVMLNVSTAELLYSPDQDYAGDDEFSYTVKDDDGASSNTASVFISITEINDLPITQDDYAFTNEETMVWIDVLANDTDVDGALIANSVNIIIPPNDGITVVNKTTGEIKYTPNDDFTGIDSFIYEVNDDDGGKSSSNVSVTVKNVNDPPMVNPDSDTCNEDSSVWTDVVNNDFDSDGTLNLNSLAVVNPPENGSISVNHSTGEILYTPDPDFYGINYYEYQIADNDGLSDTAWVTITVDNVNDPPIINFTFTPMTPTTYQIITFNSSFFDDGFIVNWTWDMDDGTILYGDQIMYQYTNDGEYFVSLTAMDNDGASESKIHMITVSNQAPVVVDDSDTCNEDEAIWTDILSNDNDVDGTLNLSTLSIITLPLHGFLNVNMTTGMIKYIPDAEWNGIDTYEYQISDDDGATDTAIVTITVNDINDPPIADFIFSPSILIVHQQVTFNASMSYDSDGIIINWTWDFDDGNSSYKMQPTHRYQNPGEYQVCLTITDDDRRIEMICKTIIVFSNIPADMNGDGRLNSGDLRYLGLYLSGNPDYQPLMMDGDVNSDGRINSGDLRYLGLYLSGNPDYSPIYP